MSKGFPPPKADLLQVANTILDAIERGDEDVYPDAMSEAIMQTYAVDAKAVERQFAVYLP